MTEPTFDPWALDSETDTAFAQIESVLEQLRTATPTEDTIAVLHEVASDAAETEREALGILIATERSLRVPAEAGATTSETSIADGLVGGARPSVTRDDETGKTLDPRTAHAGIAYEDATGVPFVDPNGDDVILYVRFWSDPLGALPAIDDDELRAVHPGIDDNTWEIWFCEAFHRGETEKEERRFAAWPDDLPIGHVEFHFDRIGGPRVPGARIEQTIFVPEGPPVRKSEVLRTRGTPSKQPERVTTATADRVKFVQVPSNAGARTTASPSNQPGLQTKGNIIYEPTHDPCSLCDEAMLALATARDVVDQLRTASPTEDVIDVLTTIAVGASELERDAAGILCDAEHSIRRPADTGAAIPNTRVEDGFPGKGGRS